MLVTSPRQRFRYRQHPTSVHGMETFDGGRFEITMEGRYQIIVTNSLSSKEENNGEENNRKVWELKEEKRKRRWRRLTLE